MFLIHCLSYDDLNTKLNAGGLGKTKYDIVDSYFKGLGHTGTMSDMEFAFLTAAGYTTGTLADRWKAYLETTLGHSGRLSDLFREWARS